MAAAARHSSENCTTQKFTGACKTAGPAHACACAHGERGLHFMPFGHVSRQLNKLSAHAGLYSRSRKARARSDRSCVHYFYFFLLPIVAPHAASHRACRRVHVCETETGRECCMCASLALSQTALLTTRNSLTGVDVEPRPFSWLQQRLNGASAGQSGELRPAASEAALWFFFGFFCSLLLFYHHAVIFY